jgi:hypothetical protein
MAFEPQHYKALQDKLGHDLADVLNDLHEKVFPTPKAKKSDDDDADKSE